MCLKLRYEEVYFNDTGDDGSFIWLHDSGSWIRNKVLAGLGSDWSGFLPVGIAFA